MTGTLSKQFRDFNRRWTEYFESTSIRGDDSESDTSSDAGSNLSGVTDVPDEQESQIELVQLSNTEENIVEVTTCEVGTNEINETDEMEKWEPLTTYKEKVISLCHDLDFGTPSVIEPVRNGCSNRVLGISFDTPKKASYILRVP